jgi:DNA-binding LacI/PurR family transcriptional regulator
MARNAVATIRDVARDSGYSASTASIVLSSTPLARYVRENQGEN